MIAAKEEVITTLLTVGALFLIAFRIPVVPITAEPISTRQYGEIQDPLPGSSRSFFVSVTLK